MRCCAAAIRSLNWLTTQAISNPDAATQPELRAALRAFVDYEQRATVLADADSQMVPAEVRSLIFDKFDGGNNSTPAIIASNKTGDMLAVFSGSALLCYSISRHSAKLTASASDLAGLTSDNRQGTACIHIHACHRTKCSFAAHS